MFTDFFIQGISPENEVSTFVRHLKEHSASRLSEDFRAQVEVLSSIPNFHLWNQLGQDGLKVRSDEPKVGNGQRLLYHPDAEADDPKVRYRYHACSPRHQVIDFLRRDLPLKRLVLHMLEIDRGEGVSPLPTPKPKPSASATPMEEAPNQDHQYADEPPAPPQRKRRKYGVRVRNLTSAAYCEREAVNYEQVLNQESHLQRPQFELFKEAIVSQGKVQRRLSDENRQVFLINDYSLTTGELLANKYVHLTVNKMDGETVVGCSCAAYEELQCTANQGIPQANESFLGEELTCMHARLFREEFSFMPANDLNHIQAKVQQAIDDRRKVHLVDEVFLQSTTKFSVVGERFAFVHVWFENNKCMIQCQDGTCMAECKKKHRLGRQSSNHYSKFMACLCFKTSHLPLKSCLNFTFSGTTTHRATDRDCEHIVWFFEEWDLIKPLFSEFFDSDAGDLQDSQPNYPPSQPENLDDADLWHEAQGFVYFDVETCQWTSKVLLMMAPFSQVSTCNLAFKID